MIPSKHEAMSYCFNLINRTIGRFLPVRSRIAFDNSGQMFILKFSTQLIDCLLNNYMTKMTVRIRGSFKVQLRRQSQIRFTFDTVLNFHIATNASVIRG